MAKQFECIEDQHRSFIEAQHLFFTGTAASDGRVNVSPKGMDCLRVLGPNRIIYLNVTGSGNETAGHLAKDPRMTLMWCSFEKRPLILRCYGTARAVHHSDPDWADLLTKFDQTVGARQIYDLTVDLVQTSCGYAVPFMDYAGPRDTLTQWATKQGDDGLRTYWDARNRKTIDGADTGIEANLTE
ncbi:pyridoxamine 5'-phosphate oxidase family protein [Pseudoprimorskyibacter insulae]|uniref:Pyridoxamine 5'-phosphate oxidase N-terminal domain-containing protein n=1 Tax=Pseudoprimorskyibacter insulae TaxID=1695997 RepID=A0A2R8AX06_9RHOB|nr:pyridoxamine 5'-phosphate oxidase family protein [Pseudoprimorskyibacter insulae]SPF80571.1 hypothetical protein PRI8871_02381 [Pseudoprimorskyibacter insulae]